jgi:hypothetical protein
MWADLLTRAAGGGSLNELLQDHIFIAGLGVTADALLIRLPVLAHCPHCGRNDAHDSDIGIPEEPVERPHITFAYARDALDHLFNSCVNVSGAEREHWVDPYHLIRENRLFFLLEAVYLPVRDRFGVTHCATREAAAFLNEQIASYKRSLAAQGRLRTRACVYCTFPDADVKWIVD